MNRFVLGSALSVALAHGAFAQSASPGPQPNSFSLPGAKVAGRVYFPATASAPANAALPAANRLYATPLFIASGSVLKTLSFSIGTGNAAAWNARMCVYADNGGTPGSLVTDSGTVAIASGSVTGNQTASLNSGNGVTVGPGWVWLAFMADSASESLLSWSAGLSTLSGPMTSLLGAASVAAVYGGTGSNAVYMAQTFGPCPASFSASPTLNSGAVAPFIAAGF